MAGETVLVCGSCDRAIEECAFCEAETCAEACCYQCMTVELGETIRAPHEHGG